MTDMVVRVACFYNCGRTIAADDAYLYQRVHGWVKKREAGGTNHVVFPEPRDEYACTECISKLKRGLAPSQGSLL